MSTVSDEADGSPLSLATRVSWKKKKEKKERMRTKSQIRLLEN